MDLLRMVIRDQENVGDLHKKSVVKPITTSNKSTLGTWVRVQSFLHRSEQVAQRQKNIQHKLFALEVRVDVLLDEVQQIKKKYKLK